MAEMAAKSVPFSPPVVHHNKDSWGPTSENLPQQFVDVPYAPFGKGDRLGRAADFTMSSYYSAKQKYRRDRENRAGDDFKNEEFQYKYDAVEDSSFHLVDTAKAKTSRFNQGFKKPWQTRGRGRGAWGKGGRGQGQQDQFGKGGKGGRGNQQAKGGKNGKGGRGRGRGWGRRDRVQRVDRGSSVKVAADWKCVEEFDLAQLTKLSTKVPEATDLLWAGELGTYNDAYDRLSTRADKPLQRCENREFYYVTTTDDPAIEKLAEEQAGTVYGTDAIFSLLMASPRSVYPWDVIVQKLDGTLVFDKRDTAAFDFLTVSETSHEPPVAPNPDQEDDKDKKPGDEINTPEKLSIEATMINQNFSQQILKTDPAPEKMALPNPFADAESESKPASMAYRYRKFALGEHTIVARTELHGLVEKRGEKHKMTAYCLNEWDSKLSGGVEWRQKIDSQRGAVLATELKNNSCKLARWTAQSILAGAEQMKLGYVSRVARTNPYDHVVLATQFYKPREFATQITLNVNNMWGIIKMLVDLLLSYDDGKYVIARDGAKPIVRIYAVPNNTFDDESDEDDVELQNANDSDESD
jgi:translation initiation factor 3 subunit D